MKLSLFALLAAGCTMTGPPVMPANVGEVTLIQDSVAVHAELDANFQTDQCTRRVIGQCNLTDCSQHDGGSIMLATAGTVTAKTSTGHMVSIGSTVDGYMPGMVNGMFFNDNATIDFSAAGGAVPAWDKTVKTPSTSMTLNVLGPLGTANADTAHDLLFSWAMPIDDQVHLRIEDGPTTLDCYWPGSPNMASVPATAFLLMPTGTGTWRLTSTTIDQVIAGTYVVDLRVEIQSGAPATGPFFLN
jgi:hypothetical protein